MTHWCPHLVYPTSTLYIHAHKHTNAQLKWPPIHFVYLLFESCWQHCCPHIIHYERTRVELAWKEGPVPCSSNKRALTCDPWDNMPMQKQVGICGFVLIFSVMADATTVTNSNLYFKWQQILAWNIFTKHNHNLTWKSTDKW